VHRIITGCGFEYRYKRPQIQNETERNQGGKKLIGYVKAVSGGG
jgi:hypothetical protein